MLNNFARPMQQLDITVSENYIRPGDFVGKRGLYKQFRRDVINKFIQARIDEYEAARKSRKSAIMKEIVVAFESAGYRYFEAIRGEPKSFQRIGNNRMKRKIELTGHALRNYLRDSNRHQRAMPEKQPSSPVLENPPVDAYHTHRSQIEEKPDIHQRQEYLGLPRHQTVEERPPADAYPIDPLQIKENSDSDLSHEDWEYFLAALCTDDDDSVQTVTAV